MVWKWTTGLTPPVPPSLTFIVIRSETQVMSSGTSAGVFGVFGQVVVGWEAGGDDVDLFVGLGFEQADGGCEADYAAPDYYG